MAKKKRKTKKQKMLARHHFEYMEKKIAETNIQAPEKQQAIVGIEDSNGEIIDRKIVKREMTKTFSFVLTFVILLAVIYILTSFTNALDSVLKLFGLAGMY